MKYETFLLYCVLKLKSDKNKFCWHRWFIVIRFFKSVSKYFYFFLICPVKTAFVFMRCHHRCWRDVVKGSGKTFTMGGGSWLSQTDDEMGIMPRAVQQLFEIITADRSHEYTIRVSYIEIYKEELRDLLDVDNVSKDLRIREDDKGNTGNGISIWHIALALRLLVYIVVCLSG